MQNSTSAMAENDVSALKGGSNTWIIDRSCMRRDIKSPTACSALLRLQEIMLEMNDRDRLRLAASSAQDVETFYRVVGTPDH